MHRLFKYLKNNKLFEGITGDEMSLITEQFQRVTYTKGENIFQEGDAGQSMFLLIEGRAGVLKNFFGGERSLGEIQPGEHFGEMLLLSGQSRTKTMNEHSVYVSTVFQNFSEARTIDKRYQHSSFRRHATY